VPVPNVPFGTQGQPTSVSLVRYAKETKITMNNLKHYANLASKILVEETKYQFNKKIISDIFNLESESRLNIIILRLTIIDSFYSTQLNKRYFGIEEISEKIVSVAEEDENLSKKFLNHIDNEESKISEIFLGKYGIRKNGKIVGGAQSLISKYAYFLTNFKFPIYDNLVQISYPLIKEKFKDLRLKNLPDNFEYSYFERMSDLNRKSNINDFDKLDNLLWLLGKLREGSFSLILSKEKYIKLVEKIRIREKIKSKEADDIIRSYIIENLETDFILGLFTKNSLDFIKFALIEI
jgi:hypothetical protein